MKETVGCLETDPTTQVNKLRKKLQEQSIKPQDISLMLVTHGHWDHIGSISEIKSLTGLGMCETPHKAKPHD